MKDISRNAPQSKPPEGVTRGESIPRENEEVEMERQLIDECVAIMKCKDGYSDKADSELREIAKEKIL